MSIKNTDASEIRLEPDEFPLLENNDFAEAHQILSKYLEQVPKPDCWYDYSAVDIKSCEAGVAILNSNSKEQASILVAASERIDWVSNLEPRHGQNPMSLYRTVLWALINNLLRRRLPLSESDLKQIKDNVKNRYVGPKELLRQARWCLEEHGLSSELREFLLRLRGDAVQLHKKEQARIEEEIDMLIGENKNSALQDGEAWANAALAELQALPQKESSVWSLLIAHCKSATAGKPSAKWVKEAHRLLDDVGEKSFAEHLQSWLKLFASHHEAVNETNLDALKGLVWCASLQQDVSLLRALAAVVPACVKNIEHRHTYEYSGQTHEHVDRTVRAPRLANACLWVLSQSDDVEAVAQLARLRLKVRHKGILNAIEKALAETAKRLNVAPEELEELATPDFGLEDGKLQRAWNEIHLVIDFTSGKAVWNWTDANGKALKAPSAKWKIKYSNEWKELKTLSSEVEKTLVVVKERLDLMLRLERSWIYAVWRERYFDHALLSEVSRRVIWKWQQNNQETVGIWHGDAFVNANGDKVSQPKNGATMQLWHPINATTEEVAAWRRWLEKTSTRQPFKQAHREIYLLTEAERSTRIYSNRFAAHIIRQHQFNSLCSARGWKNKLRLMVDDTYPPATKLLPQHNLRAEFWIEGIGDAYGADTNDAGTYLRLATDQVRFYHLDAVENRAQAGAGDYGTRGWGATPAEPLPLEEIPPLVFSEVMRDVDLFVGVASVANDPTWNDGGPEGRHINYWNDYAFGALTETAQTRRDVLSRLLPRLKIAERCQLLDKFLQVRGDLRTYKIHLGSGNILMAPNDQYLCIVPARGTLPDNKVFLPFEGDHTMAIILSKAFLLVEDTKITDATITQQLKR